VIDDAYLTIVLNTNPYTYLGNRPLNLAPEATLDRGLASVTLRKLASETEGLSSMRIAPSLEMNGRKTSWMPVSRNWTDWVVVVSVEEALAAAAVLAVAAPGGAGVRGGAGRRARGAARTRSAGRPRRRWKRRARTSPR